MGPSGLMVYGVPTTLVASSCVFSSRRAMPKSPSLTTSESVKYTFCGFCARAKRRKDEKTMKRRETEATAFTKANASARASQFKSVGGMERVRKWVGGGGGGKDVQKQ